MTTCAFHRLKGALKSHKTRSRKVLLKYVRSILASSGDWSILVLSLVPHAKDGVLKVHVFRRTSTSKMYWKNPQLRYAVH